MRWTASAGLRCVQSVVSSFNPLFGVCGEDLRVFWAKDDYVAGADADGYRRRTRLRRAEAGAARRTPTSWSRRQSARPSDSEPRSRTDADGQRLRSRRSASRRRPCLPSRTTSSSTPPSRSSSVVSTIVSTTSVLTAVADSGLSLLLVGPCAPTYPERMLSALTSRANVQWVGARTPGQLPGLPCVPPRSASCPTSSRRSIERASL